MKLFIKHIMRSIQEHMGKRKEFPVADHVEKGSIVITEDALDIGIVGEVKDGKPSIIFTRESCYRNTRFGGIDSVTWYDTGIRTSLKEWRVIAYETKTAMGFYKYWLNRLKIDWS